MSENIPNSIPLPELAAAVQAMDQLNSYARNPKCYCVYGIQSHLYAMKNRAIELLDRLGLVGAKPVYANAKCRSCNGTGWWKRGRYADTRCNSCSDGKVKLYFREIVIGRTLQHLEWPLSDIQWHIPTSSRIASDAAEPVTSWSPRRLGRDLSPDELAGFLNLAEPAFQAPWPYAADRYKFDLGKVPELRCAFGCGAVGEDQPLYGVERGRLVWCDRVCAACEGHYRAISPEYGQFLGNHDLLRARMPIPESLLTPNILKWIERHGGLKAVVAKAIHDNY